MTLSKAVFGGVPIVSGATLGTFGSAGRCSPYGPAQPL